MAFYPGEQELPAPGRRRAVARAAFFDTQIRLMAFLKEFPDLPGDIVLPGETYLTPEGCPAERKGWTGVTAALMDAAKEWRGGHHIARLQLEIHFDPSILRSAPTSGDGADDDA